MMSGAVAARCVGHAVGLKNNTVPIRAAKDAKLLAKSQKEIPALGRDLSVLSRAQT